jgi:hypothetical protein
MDTLKIYNRLMRDTLFPLNKTELTVKNNQLECTIENFEVISGYLAITYNHNLGMSQFYFTNKDKKITLHPELFPKSLTKPLPIKSKKNQMTRTKNFTVEKFLEEIDLFFSLSLELHEANLLRNKESDIYDILVTYMLLITIGGKFTEEEKNKIRGFFQENYSYIHNLYLNFEKEKINNILNETENLIFTFRMLITHLIESFDLSEEENMINFEEEYVIIDEEEESCLIIPKIIKDKLDRLWDFNCLPYLGIPDYIKLAESC